MYRYALILLPILALPAAAQPKAFDPDATAKLIAPYIDNQTLAVAHFRTSRVSAASIDRIGGLIGWDAPMRKSVLDRLDDWKTGLDRAGIDDVFLLLSTADQCSGAAIVIPAGTLAQPKDAGKLFGALYPALLHALESDAKDRTFMAGSKAMLNHLKSLQPEERPGLAKAFAAAGDADAQLLLIPSKDHRRVLAEMMPTLSKEFGGGSTKVVTTGMHWAALGLDLGAKPALTLTVQASDGETAKALGELYGKVIDVFAKEPLADGRTIADLFGPDFATLRQALVPQVKGDQMIVTAGEAALVRGLVKLMEQANLAVAENKKKEQLTQIVIGMHNYLTAYGRFPARAGYGLTDLKELQKQGVKDPDPTMKPKADAKPLLSWRVYLLPYFEQEALYREFKLDEPWDSDHNKKLIEKIPPIYRSGSAALTKAGKTRILAPVGKGLMFEPDGPGVRISEVTDGTSNTILAVEAAEESAVIWTKPDDLMVDEKDPKKGIFDQAATVVLMAFADGTVHSIPKKIVARTLWAMFTRAGGETYQFP